MPATVAPPFPGPGSLGLFPPGMGTAGNYEVDAISYGTEPMLSFDPAMFRHSWTFSVDEFAIGAPNPPFSVFTEGAFGALEASADIFRSNTFPAGYPFAFPPFPFPGPPVPLPPGLNTQVFDGNGTTAPTLDLLEPNPPTAFPMVGSFPDPGDNLDAWDIDAPAGSVPIYFSLDSAFPDPLEIPLIVNSGTAAAQGFNGGDVLVSPLVGLPPVMYADARLLGLNEGIPLPAPNPIDVDDLDALVLWENGTGVYEPTTGPYSWMIAGSDMLLFSVRRNSGILTGPVGGPVFDALGSGLALTEGDILIPVFDPVDGIFVQDALEGDWDVGIFVNAEALGLSTVRSGGGAPWTFGTFPNPRFGFDIWDDDLDALDVEQLMLIADGDGDGDVDGRDFLVWQRGYGLVGPFVTPMMGDFNLDFMVNGGDLALWRLQYGFGSPLTADLFGVPEPTTFSLLAACGLLGLRRHK